VDRAARWAGLWQRLGARGDGGAMLRDLERHYGDARRHYHDLTHLDAVLEAFDGLRHLCDRPDEAEAALWLHDVIWRGGDDDEGASAAWGDARLAAAGVDGEVRERIAALVCATRHDGPPASRDAAVVQDADLAVLAADPATFDRYEAAVRREYAHVDDAAFRSGRAAVLRRFLERPAIFATAPMRDHAEGTARANLRRSLARLQATGAVGEGHGPP
jgi:predicted metal-dependent HD superfamily phosphohydrolase